jgi:SAM-dependent methyltransferase
LLADFSSKKWEQFLVSRYRIGFIMRTDWNNTDNKKFYEEISLETFENFAKLAGLDTGADLDQIQSYIDKASSILEIGAGYGRVIDLLLKRGYKGRLAAVERSSKFCQLLKTRFGDKITLYEGDIRDLVIPEKFDLILWLWSGISDFNHEEQLNLLKRHANHDNVTAIIDTLIHKQIPLNAIEFNHINKQYVIHTESSFVYGYMPSPKEMLNYGKNLTCKSIDHFVYALGNLNRNLYIIKK